MNPDDAISLEAAQQVYRILNEKLTVREDVPLATIGGVLRSAGITPQQFGYSKLKPFLFSLDIEQEYGFLTFKEELCSGCPQTFATIFRRPGWDDDEPAPREPVEQEIGRITDTPIAQEPGGIADEPVANKPAGSTPEIDESVELMAALNAALGIAGAQDDDRDNNRATSIDAADAAAELAPEPEPEPAPATTQTLPAETVAPATKPTILASETADPAETESAPAPHATEYADQHAPAQMASENTTQAASTPNKEPLPAARPAERVSSLEERATSVATLMASTPEYLDSPAPAALLAETGDHLTDFCYVSFNRQQDIRRNEPGCNPLAAVNAGWTAARRAGAVRLYEGKIVFPIPVMRGDAHTPVEVSIRRQEHNDGNLLPWFVSYVNDFVKPASALQGAPSKAIERFAWLGPWDEFLDALARIALDEQWDFGGMPDEQGHVHAILKSYICTTFFRLKMEKKICFSDDGQFAAFNTGLVNDRYDDIYACFRPSLGPIPWEFAGFTAAGSRGLGKELVSRFNPLPPTASYFDRKEDMLYDLSKELIIDYDHVILDNMARLPLDFLAEELRASDNALAIITELRGAADIETRKKLYQELRAIVEEDSRLFRRVRSGLNEAIDTAKRRIRWNFKTAIPSYYPRANTMSLLLPLSLLRDTVADAALVVQLMPSGNYQGQTILTMRQAYTNARLICRPDSDWLTTSQEHAGSAADDDEEEGGAV